MLRQQRTLKVFRDANLTFILSLKIKKCVKEIIPAITSNLRTTEKKKITNSNLETGDASRRKFEKIVVSWRRTLSECPAQTTLQFPTRKPNRLRCVSIGKGGFSFEFHKYLPFFISKRKNYAHPLRIPRETRSRVRYHFSINWRQPPIQFSNPPHLK